MSNLHNNCVSLIFQKPPDSNCCVISVPFLLKKIPISPQLTNRKIFKKVKKIYIFVEYLILHIFPIYQVTCTVDIIDFVLFDLWGPFSKKVVLIFLLWIIFLI